MIRINKALLTNRSGGLLYTAGKFIKYFRALKYILSPCIYKTLSNVLNDHADNGNISGCKKRRRPVPFLTIYLGGQLPPQGKNLPPQ